MTSDEWHHTGNGDRPRSVDGATEIELASEQRPAKKTYERVTYRDGKATRAVTVTLEIASETDRVLTGYKVDSEGFRVAPSKSYLREHNAVDGQVLHVIELGCITSRARLVADYKVDGSLVPAGTAEHEEKTQVQIDAATAAETKPGDPGHLYTTDEFRSARTRPRVFSPKDVVLFAPGAQKRRGWEDQQVYVMASPCCGAATLIPAHELVTSSGRLLATIPFCCGRPYSLGRAATRNGCNAVWFVTPDKERSTPDRLVVQLLWSGH